MVSTYNAHAHEIMTVGVHTLLKLGCPGTPLSGRCGTPLKVKLLIGV